MNFQISCSHLYKRLCQSTRNFGSSAVARSWFNNDKSKIDINEDPDLSRSERYFAPFKSRHGLSADVLNTLDKRGMALEDYFSIKGLKIILNDFKKRKILYNQRYCDARVEILGYDLAAAHFLVFRGGKVRFKGHTNWVEKDENDSYDLPNKYDSEYLVEEINISKMPIVYDGLLNLEGLTHLKVLNISHCPYIDDWCMDRICGQFYNSLEEIDISYCPLITERSLEMMGRLRNLRHLKAEGYEKLPNSNLIFLLLEDATPGVTIEGASL